MTMIAQTAKPAGSSGFRLVVLFGVVGLLATLVLAQQGVDFNTPVIG